MSRLLNILRFVGFSVGVAVIAGGGLWFGHQAQEDTRLKSAHLNIAGYPGYPARAWQPDYEVDLFGDGTVVFQGVYEGQAYIYHLPREKVTAYLKGFEASAFFTETKLDGAAIDSPWCGVEYSVAGKVRDGGCHVLKNGMSSEALHPQVVLLEKLVDLPLVMQLDPNHLPADVRPYSPSEGYPVSPRHLHKAPPWLFEKSS